MQGYDLDNTLAEIDYSLAGTRGLANLFASAKVIYTPSEPFVVITARPHQTSEQSQATTKWLTENQPNFKALYYVTSGTEQQVAERKARIINRLRLDGYTCENDTFNQLLKPLVRVTVYKMTADGHKVEA